VNGAGTGAERELHRHLDRGRPDPSDRQERQPGCARTGHFGHPFGVTPHRRVDCARQALRAKAKETTSIRRLIVEG
jgi:hypothetical protein